MVIFADRQRDFREDTGKIDCQNSPAKVDRRKKLGKRWLRGRKEMTRILAVSIFLWSSPAFAFSMFECDSFNSYRFDPRALETCIKDLKDELREQNTRHQNDMCDLATELNKLQPSFDTRPYCFRFKPSTRK